MNAAGWFDVNREGLAKLAARGSKSFILRELVQNAWDEASTEVRVDVLAPETGGGLSTIRVEDDSPEGFADLSHAYTLFAPSKKIEDAMKRGRFNFGEKLVLAICSEAVISTTKGTILFDRGEKRRRSPKRRPAGSVFEGKLKLTHEDRTAIVKCAQAMLVPDGKRTFVNGEEILPRTPVAEFYWSLETEVANAEGILSKKHRVTQVRVFEPLLGETAHIFEMGIPVVETDDRWHVDVGQKIPMTMERDNVHPSYLRDVRVAVANHMADRMTAEDANSALGRDALADDQVTPEAARKLIELRFGDRAVTYDPSDPEANSIAVANGYTLVHGSQLGRDEWENVRRSGALLPAGKVTPSPKPFTPGGRPLKIIERQDWAPEMVRFERFVQDVSRAIAYVNLKVVVADDRGWGFNGCIGGGVLHVNAAAFGKAWFKAIGSASMCQFLIHELGHTVESNHLSDRYHEALCDLGGKLARLALERPEIFR